MEAHMDSSIERQQAIVAEHIRCENEHDWPGVHDTFVQDDRAHYDVVPLGARFKGIEGVRDFYQTIATALPDLHIEVISAYDVPACSIREVVITGTHTGEYLGLQPLGNKVRGELAAFYLFNEDCTKLIAERIYYNAAGFAAQMQAKQAAKSA
jgi:predicted ester cyclase